MKTLALLFLAVIMSSTGLVSCIDEEVDSAVESIYRNQALLLASQAALLDAQASYETAKAAAENAYAVQTAANVAIAQNESAADIADQTEVLRLLTAQNDMLVAAAIIALDSAQLVWEASMIALQGDIAGAKVILADGYFSKFQNTHIAIAILESSKLTDESLLNIEKLFETTGGVTSEFYLAGLQVDLAKLEADLAADQLIVSEMEAAMADPSTNSGRSAELKAMKKANEEEITVNAIADAELDAQKSPLVAELAVLAGTDAALHTLESQIVAAEAAIVTLKATIVGYEAALLTAETALVTIDQDLIDAQGVINAAVAAELITDAAEIAAENAESIDQGELTVAQTALTTLVGVIGTLEGSLNAAAADLFTKQAAYDGGIVAATTLVTTTGTNITVAQGGVTTATIAYQTWRDRFEGGPTTNGGHYWEDTTSPSVVLGDDVLGTHTDASGAATTSYVRVSSWTYNDNGVAGPTPDDTYTPLTIDVAQQGTVTGPGEVAILGNGAIDPTQYLTAYPLAGSTETHFVEVGIDDVSYSNLTKFQAATTALGNEDIMDVPPVFGNADKTETDAYSVLWNAMLAEINAIDALATFGVARAAAQTVYDDLKDIYESQVTLLDAAQAVVATATADLAITAAAEDVAETADGLADAAVSAANTAKTALGTRVALESTIESIKHNITVESVDLALLELPIAAKKAKLVELFADLDADYAGESEAIAVAIADIDSQIADLTIATQASTTENTAIDLIIAALATDVAAQKAIYDAAVSAVAAAPDAINKKQTAIASGQFSVEEVQAYIVTLEAKIVGLQSQIDALGLVADEYYALMVAALQS